MMWSGMEGVGWGWIGGGATGVPDAIDILKACYAGGELTREQFEQMKCELEV